MHVLIDGKAYVEQTNNKNKSIGIGITTHNRNQLVASTYDKIKSLSPDAKIVVVDDASIQRVVIEGAEVYRFRNNVGIARAKNKCLELLQDCDHIFLFDDDTYPKVEGWETPYVESKEHHLMYLFENWASGVPVGDDAVVYQDDDIVAHHHARGCMMYVDKTVLQTVGGMDVRYGKAMNEHLDWSNRIFNAGLTTFKYMDVPHSSNLIHSMDEYKEVISSIGKSERMNGVMNNDHLLNESLTSTRFAPYGSSVVIASYFANVNDPQRGVAWKADPKAIEKLKNSVEWHGLELVLIHNCFDAPNKTTISSTPYFERWLKEWQYLRDHPEIEYAFVVDATDVEMLNNPFNKIEKGKLYIGDEPSTVGNQWMLTNHLEPSVNKVLREFGDEPLLNCGVVGGDRQTVMDLCRDMYLYHFENPQDKTDMGIFNKLLYTKYSAIKDYGRHVTTIFKANERRSPAFFKHK